MRGIIIIDCSRASSTIKYRPENAGQSKFPPIPGKQLRETKAPKSGHGRTGANGFGAVECIHIVSVCFRIGAVLDDESGSPAVGEIGWDIVWEATGIRCAPGSLISSGGMSPALTCMRGMNHQNGGMSIHRNPGAAEGRTRASSGVSRGWTMYAITHKATPGKLTLTLPETGLGPHLPGRSRGPHRIPAAAGRHRGAAHAVSRRRGLASARSGRHGVEWRTTVSQRGALTDNVYDLSGVGK